MVEGFCEEEFALSPWGFFGRVLYLLMRSSESLGRSIVSEERC